LKHIDFENDHTPLEADCTCHTCKTYTRSYLSRLMRQKETVGCHLISIHNIGYQMRLMRDIRNAIAKDEFPSWIQQFMKEYYHYRSGKKDLIHEDDANNSDPGKVLNEHGYPIWIVNALNSLKITLLPRE
jgi:hypothetical protein